MKTTNRRKLATTLIAGALVLPTQIAAKPAPTSPCEGSTEVAAKQITNVAQRPHGAGDDAWTPGALQEGDPVDVRIELANLEESTDYCLVVTHDQEYASLAVGPESTTTGALTITFTAGAATHRLDLLADVADDLSGVTGAFQIRIETKPVKTLNYNPKASDPVTEAPTGGDTENTEDNTGGTTENDEDTTGGTTPNENANDNATGGTNQDDENDEGGEDTTGGTTEDDEDTTGGTTPNENANDNATGGTNQDDEGGEDTTGGGTEDDEDTTGGTTPNENANENATGGTTEDDEDTTGGTTPNENANDNATGGTNQDDATEDDTTGGTTPDENANDDEPSDDANQDENTGSTQGGSATLDTSETNDEETVTETPAPSPAVTPTPVPEVPETPAATTPEVPAAVDVSTVAAETHPRSNEATTAELEIPTLALNGGQERQQDAPSEGAASPAARANTVTPAPAETEPTVPETIRAEAIELPRTGAADTALLVLMSLSLLIAGVVLLRRTSGEGA